MKLSNIFTILLISTIPLTSFGQLNYFNFEIDDTLYSNFIRVDTISNPYNIWAVGSPMKTLLDSAYYSKRALITDSVSNYPMNDTSVFYISLEERGFDIPYLQFQYKIDSDSLKDFGKIEVSPDSGNTWIDILKEQSTYNFSINYSSLHNLDLFTGRKTGWNNFMVLMPDWTDTFNNSDSAIFRFSFISDSIQTNQEGWMIDDLEVGWDFAKSVPELNAITEVFVYPNPVHDVLNIEITSSINQQKFTLEIYDVLGRLVLIQKLNLVKNTIDVSNLKTGMYSYRIGEVSGKIVKQF
tara:strand:+ start:119 stop:1006 length:888 start_codon:yes stop_codon:yes gene_type:complete